MYPAAMRIRKVDLMIDSDTNDCYLIVKGLIVEVSCCSLMVMALPEVLKPCAFILNFSILFMMIPPQSSRSFAYVYLDNRCH